MDIAWRNTTLRALQGMTIIVPNSKLASSIITNTWLPGKEMNVPIDVGVRYCSDLVEVERISLEVARDVVRSVPGVVTAFDPLVRFHTFADSGVKFVVIVRVAEYTDQFLVKHELLKRLDTRFRAAGIEMPAAMVMEGKG